VAPILAAAQAALAKTVNLSPQAQQAIRQRPWLVSQLVQQIQGSTVQLPANWPAGGVTPQWQALLAALVQASWPACRSNCSACSPGLRRWPRRC
jgi:hypothetical protein